MRILYLVNEMSKTKKKEVIWRFFTEQGVVARHNQRKTAVASEISRRVVSIEAWRGARTLPSRRENLENSSGVGWLVCCVSLCPGLRHCFQNMGSTNTTHTTKMAAWEMTLACRKNQSGNSSGVPTVPYVFVELRDISYDNDDGRMKFLRVYNQVRT